MIYRNRRTGEEIPGCLAFEHALEDCGLELIDSEAPGFKAFEEFFLDNYYNLEDWDEIEDEEDDEDEGEMLDLAELRKQEYLDLMRERLCV